MNMMNIIMPILFLPAAQAVGQPPAAYDVVVYDATSGGVTAAVSAGRSGLKTALLCASWPACFQEGGERVGGMSSGGLGQTDIGPTYPYIGGLALEFYTKNRAHYGDGELLLYQGQADSSCRLPSAQCNQTWNLEPHVAESIFLGMLREAGVDVFYSAQVDTVSVLNRFTEPLAPAALTVGAAAPAPMIKHIVTIDGRQFAAKVWIDASYEGDLLARAGVSYRVGREARSEHNESLAGMSAGATSNQYDLPVDPFDAAGNPLPFTSLPPSGREVGSGDKFVQSYNFRLCVTKNSSNMVPWPKPANYSADDWELLRRYVTSCSNRGRCQLGFPSCNTGEVPSSKADMNNCGGMASDFIGGSWKYPEADYDARKVIWRQHLDYQQGLLWTMANDPSIPAEVREKMAEFGLCADEFTGMTLARNWPPALYVRAARRLQGGRIFSQNTPFEQDRAGSIGNLSIGIGGYNFDSHNAQRWACPNTSACFGKGPRGIKPGQPYAWDEGDVESPPGLYQIPYWVTLPVEAEAGNLLVVAAPSATHIGMSTLRMEPQFMMIGHAAGTAAVLAVQHNTTVQRVDLTKLHASLIAEKILELPPRPAPPPPPVKSYTCIANRFVQAVDRGPYPEPGCGGTCPSLAENEWLALNEHWCSPGGTAARPTLTATHATFLKKSEVHSSPNLPPTEQLSIAAGTVIRLMKEPTVFDSLYKLITCTTVRCS